MSDSYDFGGGIGNPSPDDGSGSPAGPSSEPIFGSGLSLQQQQQNQNPLQDRTNALQIGRKFIQRNLNNPLRMFLKPEEYQQDIAKAAQYDQQLFQTEQAVQQQRDLKETAANAGLDRARINMLGATPTDKTILNAWTDKATQEGSFVAMRALASAGEVGQSILTQNEGAIMPVMAQRNEQAQTVVDKLNAAGSNQQVYSAIVENLSPAERTALSNYVPGFTIPDKVGAWQVRGKGAQGALMQAKQAVSQYELRQAGLGLTTPVNDEKEANAVQGTLFKGSTGAPIEGGNTVKLPNGEYGSSLGAGSRGDTTKPFLGYGEKGGWSNQNKENIKTYQEQLGSKEAQGILTQYKLNKSFYEVANDPKMYTSAAGIALLSDELGAVGRDLAEGTKAAGSVGLSKMLDTKYGSVANYLNKATTNWSEFKAWMDSGKQGEPPKLTPRLTPESIQGFKDVAAFKMNQASTDVKGRLGGALFTAGRYGIGLDKADIDPKLQNDPVIQEQYNQGRQSYIKDVTSHPAVFEGDTRILLRQGTTNPAAQKTPLVKDALPQNAQADQYAKTLIQIESGGKPGQQTGSYKGLGQFSDAELARHGITNPDDRTQVEDAVKRDYITNKSAIERATGIMPTDTQVYLAHQQGLGGIEAHMKNPDAPAWLNMASTAEGQRKGQEWAKQAIWGNVPTDMKRLLLRNGVSADNLTSGDFMNLWQAKFESIKNRIAGAAGTARDLADKYLMAGVPGPVANKAAASTAALGTMAEAAPVVGTVAGAVGGAASPVPGGTIMGGAAGSAAGQAVKNYMQGNDISQGVGKAAAMGAAQSIPIAGPIAGTLARGAAAGAVGAGEEALKPEALPSDILKAGVTTGLEQAGGEGFFRMVGLAGGKAMNMIYSKFNAPTQKALADAGEVIAAGKPEAPKGVAGQPATDTAKAAHEEAVQKYDSAVQMAKDHGLDPEHLGYAVEQAKANTSADVTRANLPAVAERTRLGKEYQGIKADVSATGVGTPKQAPLTNGPLSMVGKPASEGGVPQEYMGRAVEAENNITAPAKNWTEKYQQLFDERSKLLEEARAAEGGAAPDPNKARNLNALADNVEKHQEAAMMYIFGPKRGPALIAKLQETHRDYAQLMEATKGTGTDIVSGMAQEGAKGAAARAAFQKYAAGDPTAQRLANALANAKMREGKGDTGMLMASFVSMIPGLHAALPLFVAATKGAKLVNEFTSRKAAGGPVSMVQLIRREVARLTPQERQRAAAFAGRATVEASQ